MYLVDLLYETMWLWLLIAMFVLVVIAARYRTNPLMFSVREKLRQSEAQVAKLKKLSETLTQTIHNLESKLQKQLDAVEGRVTIVTGEVGEIRSEVRDIDKLVDSLETKITVATSRVEAVVHQVDNYGVELRRIDDQTKDNTGKVKSNTNHIRDLEIEVHALQRELCGPPISRLRRDHHAE